MKKQMFRKVMGIVLALAMLASLFTCMMAVPASASASDTKMLHAKATTTGLKFGWRSSSSSPLAKGVKYRLSLDWENVTGAPLGSSTLGIYCYSGGWRNIYNNSTYCSEWSVSSHALEHGNHYDIDFTLKSSLSECREFVLYFGDIGNSISNMEFNTANWVLYTRDDSNNLTDTGKTFTFPVTFRGASDGAMNSYIASYTASDKGQLWANNTSSSYARSFVDIPSGYFDVPAVAPGVPDYDDVTSKVAYFTTGNTGTLRYYNTERTLTAGEYELGFDWKVLTGNGSYLKLVIDGDTVSEGSVGVSNAGTEDDVYDTNSYTRKLYFELEEDASDIEIVIGNADTSTSAVVSGGYIKTIVDDEVTGGNKIHNIGDANFISARNGTTVNKWQPWASLNSSVTLRSTVSGLFTDAGPAARRVTFKSGNDYTVMQYEDYSPTITAGTYKLVFDCRQFTSTLLSTAVMLDGSSVSGTKEYDDLNRKMYYTFTVSAAPSDSLKIRIGNYGNGGATASVGHVYLYAIENGEITGESLIPDTNAFTLDWTTSSTEYSQIWNTRGYASSTIYYGEMPENYFAANNTAAQMGHFPAGTSGYQVLAYKDADYYLAAGTYRLTVDINNLGTAEPTVQLRSGTEIEADYSGTLISTDGFTRTYEFTVDAAAHGVGVFIGNYGKGTDLDFYFKNPTLYRYDNGAAVGYNIFEPLCTRTYDRHNWTGSRANALNARWTPINCNNDVFEIGNVSADAFPGAVVTTGTPKMANFYYGASWNVFIYNDTAVPLQKDQTYIFTANVKTTSGTPTIDLFDSYASGNVDLRGDATSAYSDVTSGNTRTITFTMAKTVSNLRIRIGNYSDATDVIASIANVKLVKQGTDANLITDLTTDTIQTTEGNRKWQIHGAASGYQNAKEAANIPAGYFEGTAQANMYYISGVTTAYSGLEKKEKVKPDTTYTLEFDWKSYGGAYPKISVSTYNGSAWSGATQTALANNTADGAAIGLLTDPTRPAVLGTYGHYAVSFTTPSDLYESGWSNLNLLFANYIKDDNYFRYGRRGSVYYGNFVLKEQGTSANIILNGDLAIAKTGNVSSEDNSTNFGGFEISIGKNNGTRDMYEELRVLPQPANFFTSDGPAAEKVMKINGGDFDYVDQGMMLKSNTAYRLTYKASYINGLGTHVVENFTADGLADITVLASSFNKSTATVTYDFRTAENLRDYFTNGNLRFVIPRNGSDIKFYVGDVKLYELSGSSTVGPNLVNNGGFNFGGEASIENVATTKYGGDTGNYMPNVQFTGWTVYGSYTQNASIDFATMDANSFPQALGFSERLVNLMRVLLGQDPASASNPYHDVNGDNTVNILDIIRTKKNAADAVDGNAAVDSQEAYFKATYVNGNNATNLSALSSANMLATAVTGNTYYISSSTGSDSNNGTSPSTPWKTLSKAMTVKASGSAVLFKCGDTWRQAKTNASALTTNGGVTYGSYGSGAKPVILGSVYNYATRSWSNQGGNIWRTSIKNTDSSSHSYDDVGIIVFDGVIGTMKDYKAELSQNGDFWCHNYADSEKGDGYVYVYADADPATKWADIEIGQKQSIINISGNGVTLNNLCVKYSGNFGMEGAGRTNVAISNCEVGYIGGAYNSQARYGNGIQFGQGGSNLRVKNCYVHDVFDSCITFQSWSDTVYNWSSINFSNNLMTDSFMGLEWFAQPTSNISNIYFTNNIIRNMGGWGYEQRLGNPETIGKLVCACMKVTKGADYYYENVSDFYIYDNTFDRSNGALIFWWWNAKDTAEEDKLDMPGLHVYRNNFYQDNAPERDGRLMNFADESAVYGASDAALALAVSTFDSNPGTVKYIIHDDRVIYQ